MNLKLLLKSRLILTVLSCVVALGIQAQTIRIGGYEASGTHEGYPLFFVTGTSITVSSSAGSFDYVYVDDKQVSSSYSYWSSYTLDISEYQGVHKLQLKNASTNRGICYFTRDPLIEDGVGYVLNSDDQTAVVMSLAKDVFGTDIPSTISNEGKTYSVTAIASSAFSGCSSLTWITIPNSVMSIGSSAFSGCTSLTSITIPEAVTSIGSSAFSGCTSLDTLTFNAISCADFSSSVFPSSISSLTFGNKVTRIPANFLYNGSKIENLTIPDAVTSIGNYAFENNSSLKSITFGSGLITIGGSAFSGTSIIKAFWLGNTPPSGSNYVNAKVNYVANDQYSLSNQMKYQFLSSRFTVDGVVYIPVSPAERTCDIVDCIYDEAFSSVDISEKVTNMGIEMNVVNVNQYAFYGNNYIQNLTISHNGAIGDYAFYGCSSVPEVVIPNSVTSLGASAFQNCSALEDVQIGTGIPVLQTSVFSGCSSLSSISIPGNIHEIRDYTFSGCSSLAQVTLEDVEELTDNSIHLPDWTSSSQSYNSYTFSVVPGSVLPFNYTIDNGESSRKGELYISLSGANTYYGSSFYDSGNFSFEFQESGEVTLSLSYYNYYGTGPVSVTDIVVESSNALMAIGSNGSSPLFADCPLDSVYIGRNILYNTGSWNGYSPFYRNTSLRTVTITDEETEIGDNEFYGCTNLKNVTIGNGVTTIGDWAFSGCSSLDYFAFGSAVDSIGKEAFSDCTAMTRIVSHAVTPPTCGSQALDDINKWTCVLSVPEGNTAAYQQADQWKEFFFINDDVSGVDAPSAKDQPRVKDCYDLNGKQISQPQRGLNIIRMSDGTTKKVVVR